MLDNKLIINAALTGVVPSKKDNPFLPTTPKEIAADALKVVRLGAGILHIHARDEEGSPTMDKQILREIIARIREKCCDVVITLSCSGRRQKGIEQRLSVLDLEGPYKPDMASLTLGSLNFMHEASINAPQDILLLLEKMHCLHIKPELEIFDTGMANYAAYLRKKGALQGVNYANIILGSLGTMPATADDLVHLVRGLPPETVWAATGVGGFAFIVQRLAIAMGGHVRVGLEDSMFIDVGKSELATNEKLVQRVVRLAEAMEREIASPADIRATLGLRR